MKILIATGSFPPDIGGPATYSHLIAEELKKQGTRVEVLSFGAVRHLPKVISHLSYAFKLLWHSRDADVVFAQDTSSVGLPSLLVSLLLGKIFVVRIPGDYAWEQAHRFGSRTTVEEFQSHRYGFKVEFIRKVQRLIANRADKIIVPSNGFAKIVQGWVKIPEKVVTIYNGIRLDERADLRNVSFTSKTIVSAGRLVPGKGFETLIRIMNRLQGWTLEIIGDGPLMGYLQKLIEDEGLKDRVKLSGRLTRKELLERVASSEIFVLNTEYETFSFQVVEAMMVGTPIITTRVGSLPELINDGDNGILIEPNDEAALVGAIERISSDKSIRQRLVEAGKKKVNRFSIEHTANQVKSVFNELENDSGVRKHRLMAAKILRYLFSGGTAAFTDLLLLYLFTDVFGMWYLLSSILAFLIAFIVSFTLQKFFTFQDHGLDGVHGQAITYLIVTSTNLGLNTLLIYLLVQYTGLHYLVAQIITSIVIAIESYIIYGIFIFKKKPAKDASQI